jgi:hypothetical protein
MKNAVDTSVGQPGDIYAIQVRPSEFTTVPGDQWRDYEAEAGRLKILLQVGPVSHGPQAAITVHTRIADTRQRWSFPGSYDGPIGCTRPRWEHALRGLLDFDDPCFAPRRQQSSG